MELGEILILAGAGVIIAWGIAHIVPTKAVVAGFEPISVDNRRILTMEWLVEGVTLCFVGITSLVVTLELGAEAHGAMLVNCLLAGFLLALAGLTLSTGGAHLDCSDQALPARQDMCRCPPCRRQPVMRSTR